jgi:hypothetical protein
MATQKHSTEAKNSASRAPGASSLCPVSLILDSGPNASQTLASEGEPPAGVMTCTSKAGRSINRRIAMMNMLVSTAIAGTAVATVAECAAAAVQPDDSALLELEERIFEQHELATAYDAEIIRLSAIWQTESHRLYMESLDSEGNCPLGPQERWNLVTEMPACIEHSRLVELQEPHYLEMDKLIRKMWETPAHTPEGRRAKLLVLLGVILDDDWRVHDGDVNYEIQRARDLMIEFVGGEPAAQLRDQFVGGSQDWHWQGVGMV